MIAVESESDKKGGDSGKQPENQFFLCVHCVKILKRKWAEKENFFYSCLSLMREYFCKKEKNLSKHKIAFFGKKINRNYL